MFFHAKGGTGVLSVREASGRTVSCALRPTCAMPVEYPENNGVAYGVAVVRAQPDPPAEFRGWENCPPGGTRGDGSCHIDIADFVNTEELCAIFAAPGSPLPEPGCPPGSPEPPPPPPDTTPPNTRITAGPPRATTSRRATFSFRSTELGSRFVCQLDRRALLPCSSPKRYARLKPGVHTFRVRAIDASGNVDPSADVRRWRVRA